MRRAIREHLTDFIAIAALLLAGLVVTGYILSQQQQPYPSWIPFLGDERFELKAELSTAQAVTPGQGQTVNISGVKAGDISEVELEDGKAVVTMLVEAQYADLIRSDATVLMRPRSGLQDMTMELDPGLEGEPVEEGTTIPLSQTEPNVNPDQILAALDRDTRDYLQLLLAAGGEGLGGRGKQLSAALRRFEPFGRDLAAINGLLAERRASISRSITAFRELSDTLARNDVRLAEWVTAQKEALAGFANQSEALSESLRELPSTLVATREGLESSDRLSTVLGPASTSLIPTARSFAPAQESLQRFLTATVGPIRDQIRPFTRQVQPPVRNLKQASGPARGDRERERGGLRRHQPALQRVGVQPARRRGGGLTCSGPRGSTTTRTPPSSSRTPTARCPRAVVMQSCATAVLSRGAGHGRAPVHLDPAAIHERAQVEIVCPLSPSVPRRSEAASSAGKGRSARRAMETKAPGITRILVAVGFAISCFGLALFLWLAFGGPIPLQPEGYRFTVPFQEATQLAQEVGRADLRGLGRQGEEHRALRRRLRRCDGRARLGLRADPR